MIKQRPQGTEETPIDIKRMSQTNSKPKAEPELYLSPETRETLRQILRVPTLDDDTQVVVALKDSLQRQYSRGFQEGLVEGARGVAAGDEQTPAATGERRRLSHSGHVSPSSRERRQRRRVARFRRRVRNAVATVAILGLSVILLLAFNAARPELSANNPRARHLIEFGGK
jgi:hypothetical protein